MALGSIHSLTEMSKRIVSWGSSWPLPRTDNLTTFMCRLSGNLGAWNSWSPERRSRHVQEYLTCYIHALYTHYTGCPRRNVRDFGRVFLMLNYTDITQNTYVQSRRVMEIMAREKCGRHRCRNTVRRPWSHNCPMRLPDQRDMVMQWPWRVRYSTVALTSQDNRSAAACVKYLEV